MPSTLNGTETLLVRGNQPNGIPSGEQFQTTTADIANLGGGGGGLTSQQIVTSGTTAAQASLNQFVGFKSATTGDKTVPVPTSTGSLGFIVISDLEGTAEMYPITAVPVSGSINGPDQVYTDLGSITLVDTAEGWSSI